MTRSVLTFGPVATTGSTRTVPTVQAMPSVLCFKVAT